MADVFKREPEGPTLRIALQAAPEESGVIRGSNNVTEVTFTGIRVLAIDAGSGQGRMMCTILSEMGIDEITVTDSMSEALEALKDHHFDLILGHMEKPGFDAVTFAKALRGDREAPNWATPLLLVTDEPEKSRLLTALQAGVTSFLTGAYTADRLRSQVTNILQINR
jgi:two-component system chemotaxis response regulator CheY